MIIVILAMFWPIYVSAFSGVSCRTQKSPQNLELNPLFEPQEETVSIQFTLTRHML